MPQSKPLRGLDSIVEERFRQAHDLGYTVQHDKDEHCAEELMRIGYCYIDAAASEMEGVGIDDPPALWPETTIPWKKEQSSMENAAKGAAFVAAALDLMFADLLGEV